MVEQVKDDVVQNQGEKRERQPYRVRLPGFVKEEGIGLGDVIKRVTYSAGIMPCGGCTRRGFCQHLRQLADTSRRGVRCCSF
jgi:hypothetical protein